MAPEASGRNGEGAIWSSCQEILAFRVVPSAQVGGLFAQSVMIGNGRLYLSANEHVKVFACSGGRTGRSIDKPTTRSYVSQDLAGDGIVRRFSLKKRRIAWCMRGTSRNACGDGTRARGRSLRRSGDVTLRARLAERISV